MKDIPPKKKESNKGGLRPSFSIITSLHYIAVNGNSKPIHYMVKRQQWQFRYFSKKQRVYRKINHMGSR